MQGKNLIPAVIVAWFCLVGVCGSQTVSDAPATTISPKIPRNIILIGWDGASRRRVRQALDKGDLPNLHTIAAEGTIVAIDILRVTDTKAGWAQILTGYEPEVTGVYRNNRFQPIPEGYTIFERLEKHFGPDNFVTGAVIGKKGHVDNDGPQKIPVEADNAAPRQRGRNRPRPEGTIVVENGVKYRLIPGRPYYRCSQSMDLFANDLMQNEKVAARAIEFLEQYQSKPFFLFVHFAEPDHTGHRYGENSREYYKAIVSDDEWTGTIIRKLKDLGLYDKTRVYVTADHGFDVGTKGHSDAPYVFLATNDPQVIRRGERPDVGATILDRFGLDLTKISPPLDGKSLARPFVKPLW